MKKNIGIILLVLFTILVSSCSNNGDNKEKIEGKKIETIGINSPITIQDNTIQPNY